MDGNHVVSQQTTSIHDLLCVNWDAGRTAAGRTEGSVGGICSTSNTASSHNFPGKKLQYVLKLLAKSVSQNFSRSFVS